MLARDVDPVFGAHNGFIGEGRRRSRVAHRDRAPELAAVARRSQLAHVLSVHQDRLAAPRKRRGVVEREQHEPLAHAFGLRDAGYYTIDALRIEAGRRAWGAELSPDETPLEAGLTQAVAFDKTPRFIGREALRRQRERGVARRLVQFTLDDPAAFPWGGEPILMDGRYIGELTSAGYSRRLGRAVGFGYAKSSDPETVLTDAAITAARYAIDIAGVHHSATVHVQAPR